MPDSDEKTWLDVEREATGKVTIRAERHNINLGPLDDGVWELSVYSEDGEQVCIHLSEEDGTLAELVAETGSL